MRDKRSRDNRVNFRLLGIFLHSNREVSYMQNVSGNKAGFKPSTIFILYETGWPEMPKVASVQELYYLSIIWRF